jgi:hypothetical protein
VDAAAATCRYVPEMRHSLCLPFWNYWRQNGGLERFGYPISEPLDEEIEGQTYQVQYFERRRIELHPQLPCTPVLLGLLGREVLLLEGKAPTSPPAGNDARIAYALDGNIFVMNADGSGVRQLTENLANDTDPDWSPDGTRIAFQSSRDTPDGCGMNVWVMDADGSNPLREVVNYVTVSSYSVSMLSGVKTSIMSSEHSICAFCKAS